MKKIFINLWIILFLGKLWWIWVRERMLNWCILKRVYVRYMLSFIFNFVRYLMKMWWLLILEKVLLFWIVLFMLGFVFFILLNCLCLSFIMILLNLIMEKRWVFCLWILIVYVMKFKLMICIKIYFEMYFCLI